MAVGDTQSASPGGLREFQRNWKGGTRVTQPLPEYPENSPPTPDGQPRQEASTPPTPAAVLPVCPPFDPQRLRKRMVMDQVFRWGLIILLFLVVLPAGFTNANSWNVLPVVILLGAGWLWLSMTSARAAQMLALITQALDQNPAEAEALIAQAEQRWPLQRALRLLIYHRLAVLRYRQHRFAEAAAIAQAVLSHRLGMLEDGGVSGLTGASTPTLGPVRSHLLLMLAECRLRLGDLWNAHQALTQLHSTRRNLLENLQLLSLQTRYEVQAGYDAQALHDLERKLAMADLMPPPYAAALHLHLAQAAGRTGQTLLSDWLRRRAALLATSNQVAQVLN